MSRSRVSRRFAALLLAAALLALPVVSGAAPATMDAGGSISSLWHDLTDFFASWFSWGDEDPARVHGESELGSTLDPDGATAAPPDNGFEGPLPSLDDAGQTNLGSTLDPDG